MFKMTGSRAVVFWLLVAAAGLVFHQVWNRQSAAEKWLYLFGRDARNYAAALLHSDPAAAVPLPKSLAQTQIIRRADHVLFLVWDDTALAFTIGGAPADGKPWRRVQPNWYVREPAAP